MESRVLKTFDIERCFQCNKAYRNDEPFPRHHMCQDDDNAGANDREVLLGFLDARDSNNSILRIPPPPTTQDAGVNVYM